MTTWKPNDLDDLSSKLPMPFSRGAEFRRKDTCKPVLSITAFSQTDLEHDRITSLPEADITTLQAPLDVGIDMLADSSAPFSAQPPIIIHQELWCAPWAIRSSILWDPKVK